MSYSSYVGKRDYLTGKFRVIGMSQELNDELKDELEEFCLELISKDTGSAIAINSLTNGKYTVEMAKRIEEPKTLKVHHIVHGLIVSWRELEIITEKYIAEGRAEELFFAEKVDLVCQGKWTPPEVDFSRELEGDAMKNFLNAMDYEEVVRLSFALYEVGKKDRKIQLIVEEEKKPVVFAALFKLALMSGAFALSFLMNGETTSDCPHFLLTDPLDFMDSQKYEKMTLEELVQTYGRPHSILEDHNEDMRRVDDLVDFCQQFLEDWTIKDRELYQRTGSLLSQDKKLYIQFINQLKNMLEYVGYNLGDTERYMKLVYLAFKNVETSGLQGSELEAAGPYDYTQMINFLREISGKKDKEFKKLLSAMLQTQMECCLGANQAVEIRKPIVTMLQRCMFGPYKEDLEE